jgi:hypothetical protein
MKYQKADLTEPVHSNGNQPVDPDELVSRVNKIVVGGQTTLVRLSQLNSDIRYQRGIRHKVIKAIVEQFNAAMFGPLLVNRRADGTLWIVDGQHRKIGLGRLHPGEDPWVSCIIIEIGVYVEEATLFGALNGRSSHTETTHAEQVAISLIRRDKKWLEIQAVLSREGYSLKFGPDVAGEQRNWRRVAHTSTLERIYAFSPALLAETIRFIEATWPNKQNSTCGEVLLGIAAFIAAVSGCDATQTSRGWEPISALLSKCSIQKFRESAKGMVACYPCYQRFAEVMMNEHNRLCGNTKAGKKRHISRHPGSKWFQ